MIVKDNEYFESLQYESRLIDIHIMSLSHYKTLLNMCNIMALEVYFNYDPIKGPKDHLHIEFELDKRNLRKSISAVVSNSWVKAKKKVALDNEDTWIGYKSLFHSMRILDFGIQIAETGKINDYTRASHLWDEILKMSDDGVSFEDIMKHYKPIQNANQTKFRQLAPKE